MAVIIPNVGDTGPTNERYVTLNQAEPDSLDFESLSNSGRSGVLSGCAVTTNSSTTNVLVSSGVVVINGVNYSVAGGTITLPDAPQSPDNERFDLVVARLFSGNVSVVVISGYSDNGGVRFPNTRSTALSFDSSTMLDLDTDVVLASLYRNLGNTVTSSYITDKRVMLSSSIFDVGAAAPLDSYGSTGSIFFRNNRTSSDPGSGVYVKNSAGEWLELGQNTGYQIPVGGIMAWPARTTIPTGWLECDGSTTVSISTYSELYAALGSGAVYGHNTVSGTFTIPDLREKVVRGSATNSAIGTVGGANTQSVPLLEHRHTLEHEHDMDHRHKVQHSHDSSANNNTTNHTHGIGHNHDVSSSGTYDGTHFHNGWFLKVFSGYGTSTGNYNYEAARPYKAPTSGSAISANDPVNASWNLNYNRSAYNARITGAWAQSFNEDPPNEDINDGKHSHNGSTNAQTGNNSANNTSAHNHGVTVDSETPYSAGPIYNSSNNSRTVTGKNSNNSVNSNTTKYTSSMGNTSPTISTIPAHLNMVWIIRAKGDISPAVSDGTNILSEAREEVVTIELSGSGALPATLTGAAYYRVPWAATLTAVKANRNGTSTNGAVTIDVNEGGTSVLSTEITIDQNESSSLTAATPAVISDSAIANDALLTFDIDSANESDEGPLTVTLYFTRNN